MRGMTRSGCSVLGASKPITHGVVTQATKVDGVFDCDPLKNPDAVMHRMLSYGDVRTQQLGVMDETAITLCKENDMPVVVFNLTTPGNILRAVTGDMSIGTTVCHTLVRPSPAPYRSSDRVRRSLFSRIFVRLAYCRMITGG